MNARLGGTLDGRYTPEKLTDALRAVCEVAGLDHSRRTLLRFVSNGVFLLDNEQVVVRLVLTPSLVHRTAKVVRVARWLAEHDFPSVRLLPDFPEELRVGAHTATLWRAVAHSGPAPSPDGLACLLRRLHELPGPDFELPLWDPLDDIQRRLVDAEDLDPADLALLTERCSSIRERLTSVESVLGFGVVHGDARLGNVIGGPDGPVLCDFDSVCLAPREWDFVPMAVGSLRMGRPAGEYQRFVETYGFDVTTWPGFGVLRELRELKLATSVLPVLRSNPAVWAEFHHRLACIRDRDETSRWTPY